MSTARCARRSPATSTSTRRASSSASTAWRSSRAASVSAAAPASRCRTSSRAWFRRRPGRRRRFREPWSAGETVSASIGQGFDLVTPLQLAVAYARDRATAARVVRPRLVLRIAGSRRPASIGGAGAGDGQHGARLAREPRDRARRRSTASSRSRAAPAGARACPGMQVAGKTGTAQVVHLEHTEDLDDDEVPMRVPRPRLVRRLRAGRCAARSWSRCSTSTADTAAAPRRRSCSACSRAGRRSTCRPRRWPKLKTEAPMWGIDRRLVQNFDWTLFGLVFSLVAIGIVNLISSTHSSRGHLRRGAPAADLARHRLRGAGGHGRDRLPPLRALRRCRSSWSSLLLLAATLVLAPVTRGSQSWLFGGRVQPSELAKIALVLMLARFFQRNPPGEIRARARSDPPARRSSGCRSALIVLQRDTGVALLTLLIGVDLPAFVRIPVARAGPASRCSALAALRGALDLLARALSEGAASSTWSIPGAIRSPPATR